MKFLIYLTFLFLFCHGLSRAQSDPEPLKQNPESLRQISDAFQVDFAYDPTLENSFSKLNASLDEDLEQSLEKLFQHSGIEFIIQDHLVLLRRKKTALKKAWRISGQIADIQSQEHLPYTIISDNLGNQYETDSLGNFSLEYNKIRPDSLFFRYLGYATGKLDLLGITGKDPLKIQLQAYPQEIPTINISSPVFPLNTSGISTLNRESIENGPSQLVSGDILRTIQLQSGISAHKDVSSGIEIRGSEAWETMINLDGMVIYNPYHFYNLFSAINGHYVDRAWLYKNDIPIEYTGKTGGLVKMSSSDRIVHNVKFNGDVDLLNSSGFFKVPVTKNSSFQMAGRASYTDLSQRSFFRTISASNNTENEPINGKNLIQQLNPDFNYYDVNARFLSKIGTKGKLDLNLFYSRDQYGNQKLVDKSPRSNITNYIFNYNDASQWGNLAASANYHFTIFGQGKSSLVIQYSSSSFSDDFNYQNLIESRGSIKDFSIQNQLDNQIEDLHLNWNNLVHFNSNNSLIFGLETGRFVTQTYIQQDSTVQMDDQSEEVPISIFQEYQWSNESTRIKVGTRLNFLSTQNKWLIDPRLSFSHKPASIPGYLYGSVSINHQFLSQFSFENRLGQSFDFWVLANAQFPVVTSYNSMLGYRYSNDHFNMSTELYFRQKYGLTEYALVNPGIPENNNPPDNYFRFFEGKARILGIDLSIGKQIKDYQTSINYTLSSNVNAFENIFKGAYFPDHDHRLHQLKWINQLSIGSFRIYGNTIFSSGKPYLDISQLQNNIPRKDLTLDQYLNYLPPYWRIDLGFDYSFKIREQEMELGASIFNLLNRKNVYNIQYIKPVNVNHQNKDEFLPVGAESGLLGRTINFKFSLKID